MVVLCLGLGARAAGTSSSEALFSEAMQFSDSRRDAATSLLIDPTLGPAGRRCVRESAWYALGLLMRDGPGDRARALQVIDRVLANQLSGPGQPWDGTFRRFPEDPTPRPDAVMWRDYDPNWREFIGTTFALTLIQFEPSLPRDLCARMTEAIRRAVEGERAQKRLTPHYTNIAIMYGFLLSYAGHRLDRPEWIAESERWAGEVHALYARTGTFEEYNSPTYYGVDLFGLALWRRYGPSDALRRYGKEMEAGLWREIALFYNAELRNLCGPFDRAYGMDMNAYVSLVGAWISLGVPAAARPLPDSGRPMDHERDFECIPTYVAVGAEVPADVASSLVCFGGERLLSRTIDEHRKATAWISRDLMVGGETTGLTRASGERLGQFHPATIHWRLGRAGIGWIVLREAPPIDATAETGLLRITTVKGESVFWVRAPGIDPKTIAPHQWELPGLSLSVETDGTIEPVSVQDGVVRVAYRDASRLVLRPRRVMPAPAP